MVKFDQIELNPSFKGQWALITGGTRGIGKQLALALAQAGMNIAVIGKTKDPHPKLEGTLDETKAAVEAFGVKCLAIQADVRVDAHVQEAFNELSKHTKHLKVLINNAGSVQLGNTQTTEMKRFDLIQQINVRGAFLMVQTFLPLLKAAQGAHILNVAPPVDIKMKWLAPHLPYTLSKFGLSMMSLGWAGEFKDFKIQVNSLWPKTLIETAAMNLFEGIEISKDCRTPEIVSDAAKLIFNSASTGRWLLDEEMLREAGISDFSKYQREGADPKPDLYVEPFKK